MQRTRNHLIDIAQSGIPKLAKQMAALWILILLAYLASGCALSPDTPAPPAVAKSSESQVPAKGTPAGGQVLTLQDLSVRDERGQTTLLVKFSQPIKEFRHFPLPAPARIVLDVFGNAKPSGQVDIYRIDTSAVSTLRISQVESGLRLTADIAAATVPPYAITQEDGGLRITIGT